MIVAAARETNLGLGTGIDDCPSCGGSLIETRGAPVCTSCGHVPSNRSVWRDGIAELRSASAGPLGSVIFPRACSPRCNSVFNMGRAILLATLQKRFTGGYLHKKLKQVRANIKRIVYALDLSERIISRAGVLSIRFNRIGRECVSVGRKSVSVDMLAAVSIWWASRSTGVVLTERELTTVAGVDRCLFRHAVLEYSRIMGGSRASGGRVIRMVIDILGHFGITFSMPDIITVSRSAPFIGTDKIKAGMIAFVMLRAAGAEIYTKDVAAFIGSSAGTLTNAFRRTFHAMGREYTLLSQFTSEFCSRTFHVNITKQEVNLMSESNETGTSVAPAIRKAIVSDVQRMAFVPAPVPASDKHKRRRGRPKKTPAPNARKAPRIGSNPVTCLSKGGLEGGVATIPGPGKAGKTATDAEAEELESVPIKTFGDTYRCPKCSRYFMNRFVAEGHVKTCKAAVPGAVVFRIEDTHLIELFNEIHSRLGSETEAETLAAIIEGTYTDLVKQ